MAATLWLVFGLASFVLGLRTLSDGLRRAAGTRLEGWLAAATKNRWRGLLTGVAVTGVIQSSSATNVMVVGLVQAELLGLPQAVSVMLGANVGTTMTSQLLAFDLQRWAPAAVAFGLVLHGAASFVNVYWARRFRFGGRAAVGFGALLLGMEAMRLALAPIAALEGVHWWLVRMAEQPLLGIAAGAVLTAVVQSSSMTTGMTMVMVEGGLVDLPGAVGIVLGANIGTVATTLIAAVGASVHGKRAALADLIFNVIGVLLFIPFLPFFARFLQATAADAARQVANGQLLFNAITAAAVAPFVPQLALLATRLAPGGRGQE